MQGKTEGEGECNGKVSRVCTLVSRALFHRLEIEGTAHRKATYTFAACGGNRALDGITFKVGDGPDDTDATNAGQYLPRLWCGDESFFFGGEDAYAFDHAQSAPDGKWPKPGDGKVHDAECGSGRFKAGGGDDRVSTRRRFRGVRKRRASQQVYLCSRGAAEAGCGRDARRDGGRRLRSCGKRDGDGVERGGEEPMPCAGGGARYTRRRSGGLDRVAHIESALAVGSRNQPK